MRILEIIILTFCAIIMGGFAVNMICFAVAIVIDVLRDKVNNRKNNRKKDWNCESCVNYGCVANNSICEICNRGSRYEYDMQVHRLEEDVINKERFI